MNDRDVGYRVILFLLLFLLIPADIPVYFLRPCYRRDIIFKSVNTLNFLKIQDPVSILGLPVGQVKDIRWKDSGTIVEIETSRRLDMHRDYRVVAEARGFMGDRYLRIDPGSGAAPLIPKNEPLQGSVTIGPVEMLAYIVQLQEKRKKIFALTGELHGNAGQSFVSRFWSGAADNRQYDRLSDEIYSAPRPDNRR